MKDGIGVFNPIMVENINKLPEPEDYEDPAVLKRQKSNEKKKMVSKSPLKSSQKPNIAEKSKSPAKPAASSKLTGKLDRKNTAPKLVLTNQNKKNERDFTQFEMPGTFKTQYGLYQVHQQSIKKPKV